MTQSISRLNGASDSIKQGAPKVGEGSDTNLLRPRCGYISHVSKHDLEA